MMLTSKFLGKFLVTCLAIFGTCGKLSEDLPQLSLFQCIELSKCIFKSLCSAECPLVSRYIEGLLLAQTRLSDSSAIYLRFLQDRFEPMHLYWKTPVQLKTQPTSFKAVFPVSTMLPLSALLTNSAHHCIIGRRCSR